VGRTNQPRLPEADDHPIAWFSALLRGVAEADSILIETAERHLERLGYFVVPMPRPTPPRDAEGRGGAR
jgi:hypothetical protein